MGVVGVALHCVAGLSVWKQADPGVLDCGSNQGLLALLGISK